MAEQPFAIEPLTSSQRERVLAELARPAKHVRDLTWYRDRVRDMEGGVLYKLVPDPAVGALAIWYRLRGAAKQLDLELFWPAGRPRPGQAYDAIYVALAPLEEREAAPRRNGHARPSLAARPLAASSA
jgi:hypothetical protein